MHKFYHTIFITFLLTLFGCGNYQQPTPAISFNETIEDLLTKETNNLYDEDIAPGLPGTMQAILKMKKYTYTTNQSDTIEYQFYNGKLCYTLITFKNQSYETLLKSFSKNKQAEKMYKNIFKINDVCIRAGVEHQNNASLLYLNDINNEISDILDNEYFQKIKSDSSYLSNDHFVVQLIFALYGRVRYSSMTDTYNYYEGLL